MAYAYLTVQSLRFKVWFKNVKCKISCSNCVVNKTVNNIDIDVDGDGVADLSIPL